MRLKLLASTWLCLLLAAAMVSVDCLGSACDLRCVGCAATGSASPASGSDHCRVQPTAGARSLAAVHGCGRSVCTLPALQAGMRVDGVDPIDPLGTPPAPSLQLVHALVPGSPVPIAPPGASAVHAPPLTSVLRV